ncbi:hypothetical protein Fmac_032768 [Flemingia macrophylla]|uniref:Uncharacterized protein n=1 Tax=Flemingia macrophylla TaxID=520843 RepID=A0ABD1L5U7_9FABA
MFISGTTARHLNSFASATSPTSCAPPSTPTSSTLSTPTSPGIVITAAPATRPPPSPGEPAAPSPHRKINVNQNRYAMVSAITVSTIPSLVLTRGHRVGSVPKHPLVISDFIDGVEKAKEAIKVLKQIGAYPDAEKAKDSHDVRPGKGKMRNCHYISCKGPLVVYGTKGAKVVKDFCNVPGVEVANVEKLNLLKLAPGGNLGRLKMVNFYLARIINSDEVHSVVRPIKKDYKRATFKKNPFSMSDRIEEQLR